MPSPLSLARLCFVIVLAVFYALATLVLVVHGLRLLWLSLARLTTSPEAEAPEPPSWPRVCVQLPVYNEPEVIERAIAALRRLDYPEMEIQVLDDSTDVTTERAARAVRRAQAAGVRATHIRRDSRDGFKAGALANGMQHTDAELFAVFDADFLPEPDTLRRLVAPLAADPSLAFVQARWAHLNRDDSWLTRAQGALLDLHFAVEQAGRQRLRRFLPFNGTAGVWRREAIEAAGGWRGDTLAEDLDLSLRAWLGGARGAFIERVAVPAELPADLGAWRRQQARWAEGMTSVTRLHARSLLRARQPLALRLHALLALSAPASFVALLAVILLHPVLAVAQALGAGPGEAFFTALGAGWLGLLGAIVAHVVAQRAVGPAGAGRRLADFGARPLRPRRPRDDRHPGRRPRPRGTEDEVRPNPQRRGSRDGAGQPRGHGARGVHARRSHRAGGARSLGRPPVPDPLREHPHAGRLGTGKWTWRPRARADSGPRLNREAAAAVYLEATRLRLLTARCPLPRPHPRPRSRLPPA